MLVAFACLVLGATPARTSSTTALYVVRVDPRLCPSPLCGGYVVALANGARTRGADGLRRPRCYATSAIDGVGSALGGIAEGALVRGTLEAGWDDLGELHVQAVYAPAQGEFARSDNGGRDFRAARLSLRAPLPRA